MKFRSREDAEDLLGMAQTLGDKEIQTMFDFAETSDNDVFYDLGSGDGYIVAKAITVGKVRKSNGIEKDLKRFIQSVEEYRDEPKLTSKIEFWRADFNKFDFSDATIVLNIHAESMREVSHYNKIFQNKSNVKIIKTDLPLVGYLPTKLNRRHRNAWFYLMKTPLSESRTSDKNEWASSVFNYEPHLIKDVENHYESLLKKRELNRKDRNQFLDDFQKLVNKRFPK